MVADANGHVDERISDRDDLFVVASGHHQHPTIGQLVADSDDVSVDEEITGVDDRG